MLYLLSALTLLAVPQGPANHVVINELSYDDSSTDDFEFVELYNPTASAVDISNWTIQDEDQTTGIGHTYVMNPGSVIAPGGYFVWGASTVPNVNQGVPGGTNLLENSEESVFLSDSGGVVIDRIDYETLGSTWLPAGREGDGMSGAYIAIAGLVAGPPTLQRVIDGVDTDVNGRDFRLMPWTPGASNAVPSILPYIDDFNAHALGFLLPEWSPSFVEGTVIDPTALVPGNPNVIPASPNGGNAAVFWDPTGGGDQNALITTGIKNVAFECYAYVESTPPPDLGANPNLIHNGESWSLGVRGSTDTFGHHPDISGVFTTQIAGSFWKSGCTGIAWVYQRLSSDVANAVPGYVRVWLVDFGDGGSDFTVLHTENIQAGVNDGWQRLRIIVAGEHIMANYGGTFGANDGVSINAKTTTTEAGGVYIGYREHFSDNGATRPVTLDQIFVRPTQMDLEHEGTSAANTQGTPTIDTDNLPYFGNPNFTVRASKLIASQPGVLVIGFVTLAQPGLPLSVIGGLPNSFLQVNSVDALTIASNASGEATVSFPVPSTTVLGGAPLVFQAFGVDPALAVSVKIANTDVVRVRIGN